MSRPSAIRFLAALAFFSAATLSGGGCSSGGDSTAPTVASVVITPSSLILNGIGVTGSLTAAVLDSRGRPVANATVTWTSESATVATVSGAGLSATVTSVSNGTATIRATSGTLSGTAVVTVQARVLRVTVTPGSLTLRAGETGPLTATVDADPGVATTYTWETSALNVATVSAAGLVTAIGRGLATITAKATADPTKTAAALVNVLGVTSVTVSPKPVTIDRGATQQMTATVVVDAGVSNAVTWRSTNTSRVSVSNAGLITAVNPGSAYVVATASADAAKRDSSLVTVRDACATPISYTLGTSLNGSITAADCQGLSDNYVFTLNAVTFYSATLTPVAKSYFTPLEEAAAFFDVNAGATSTAFALAGIGTHGFFVAAWGADSAFRGTYTLSTTVNPAFPANCPVVYTGFAVTRSFTLTNACSLYSPAGLAGTFYAQPYLIALPPAKTLRVTATAATFQVRIELKNFQNTTVLASGFAAAPGATAVMTYTPSSATNALLLWITSQTPAAVGSFTITIDP